MATSTCVSIQFDKQAFSTDVACHKWIRSSEFAYLEQIKGFKLNSIANSVWMTTENRRVFQWTQGLAQCKHLIVLRPSVHVLVILRGSTELYSRSELPALSEKAQKRLRVAERKQEIKDQEKLERREKILLKRKRLAATNKGSSVSLAKEIAKLDKKLEEKSNPKKRVPPPPRKKKVKTEEVDDLVITEEDVQNFNKAVVDSFGENNSIVLS